MSRSVKLATHEVMKGIRLSQEQEDKLRRRIEAALHRMFGQGYYEGANAALEVERQIMLDEMLKKKGVKL